MLQLPGGGVDCHVSYNRTLRTGSGSEGSSPKQNVPCVVRLRDRSQASVSGFIGEVEGGARLFTSHVFEP